MYANEALCRLIDCKLYDILGEQISSLRPQVSRSNARAEIADDEGATRRDYVSNVFSSAGRKSRELTFKVERVFDGVADADARVPPLYFLLLAVEARTLKPSARKRTEAPDGDPLQAQYPDTSMNVHQARSLFRRLTTAMHNEQLYLDPQFGLPEAARALRTNQLYLSQSVNFCTGGGFREYINQFRIAHLQLNPELTRATDPMHLHTVAGFGSYSALRRYLKEHYQATPREFKLQVADAID